MTFYEHTQSPTKDAETLPEAPPPQQASRSPTAMGAICGVLAALVTVVLVTDGTPVILLVTFAIIVGVAAGVVFGIIRHQTK